MSGSELLTPPGETFWCPECKLMDFRGVVTGSGEVLCPNCYHIVSRRPQYQGEGD